MPLYEYECDACGHRFEAIQKFSDPPLDRCPKCGGALRKLQSAPAFQFKGSGWYITDYARKGQAAEGSGPGGSDGSDGTKAEKTEKPESRKSGDTAPPAAAPAPPPAPSAKDSKDSKGKDSKDSKSAKD